MTDKPKTFRLDMLVDDAKTLDFLNIWIRAGLTQLMGQAGIGCEIGVTGKVFSVVIRRKD